MPTGTKVGKAVSWLLCLVLCVGLSSCGFGVWVSALFGGTMSVRVSISPKVNQESPIQTDVLLVYDELLYKQLMSLTAQEWYEKRSEIRAGYPEGEGFDSWSWEWTPGQNVAPKELPLKVRAVGGIVFANYHTAGPHRLPIDPHSDVKIVYQEKDFIIEPAK